MALLVNSFESLHPYVCIEFSASCVSFQLYEILEFMSQASLMAQMVKNLPAMQETLVQSLGREDPLEEGVVTHSSILAWRISWTEEPGRLQSIILFLSRGLGLQSSQVLHWALTLQATIHPKLQTRYHTSRGRFYSPEASENI